MPSCPSTLPAYAGAALTVGTVIATVGGCLGIDLLAERLLGLPTSSDRSRTEHLVATDPEVAGWHAWQQACGRRNVSDVSRLGADEDSFDVHVSHRIRLDARAKPQER
jgi:hypothetical protein